MNEIFQRRLRAGIVGGGPGSFIGAVHRVAAELDGQAQVVAGAMSADPQKAREAAAAWFLPRSYESYTDMAEAEAARPDPIDFVIIATPNHLHFLVAKAFLERGFHVVCDKPMTLTLQDALPHQNLTPNCSIASGQDIPVEHPAESGEGNGPRITSSCHCSFRASSR